MIKATWVFVDGDRYCKSLESCRRENKRGGQKKYSDTGIRKRLTIRKIYRLLMRQKEGFRESFFKLKKVDVAVPEFMMLYTIRRSF